MGALTAAHSAYAQSASTGAGEALCAGLVRQALKSPRSFTPVLSKVVPNLSLPEYFEVLLRFDAANQFGAMTRYQALCKFNGVRLPYWVQVETTVIREGEIAALDQLRAEEEAAKPR